MENVSESLRGECTRFMLEIKAGVFLGSISAAVRELLWEKVKEGCDSGGAVLAYAAQTEQAFKLEMWGNPHRTVIDLDGVFLIETACYLKKMGTARGDEPLFS
jgi:CRISPR-associated protein Cas2